MANVQKFTVSASGHMCAHYERAKGEDGEYIRFGNQNINLERTLGNYNLAPDRPGGQMNFIRERTSEVKCLKRDDVNVMCTWVLTAPKDLPQADERIFFKSAYDFMAGRYGGEQNIISAYVHVDEVTPHMHFAFVPVVKDKKKGIDKVSAKELVTKLDLQTFHEDLSRHMEQVLGRDVGILNEATRDGNRSIEELKRNTAVEIMQGAREQAAQIVRVADEDASKIVFKGQARVEALERREQTLQGNIEGLEGKLEGVMLSSKQIDKIPVRLTRLSQVPGTHESRIEIVVSKRDWENIKKTAIQGARNVTQENNNANREKSLDNRERAVKQREDAVANDEIGLEAQRKRADYWVSQSRTYEANYNRVLKELNQIKNRNRTQERDL